MHLNWFCDPFRGPNSQYSWALTQRSGASFAQFLVVSNRRHISCVSITCAQHSLCFIINNQNTNWFFSYEVSECLKYIIIKLLCFAKLGGLLTHSTVFPIVDSFGYLTLIGNIGDFSANWVLFRKFSHILSIWHLSYLDFKTSILDINTFVCAS